MLLSALLSAPGPAEGRGTKMEAQRLPKLFSGVPDAHRPETPAKRLTHLIEQKSYINT